MPSPNPGVVAPSQPPSSATIVYGADHNASWQSEDLRRVLSELGDVVDVADADPTMNNYVDISDRVCALTLQHKGTGVIICGTGIGASIVANKHRGIYAARCLTRSDAIDGKRINNANVLCLSAKTDIHQNLAIAEVFFATRFVPVEKRMDRALRIDLVESRNFQSRSNATV